MSKRDEKKQKQLEHLQQDYESVRQQLCAVGIAMPGSVVRRSYRCGKKSCRCHRDSEALHGPYYQWTSKVKAKTVGMNLNASVVPMAKEWTRNARKMRRQIGRLHQIARKMLKVMAELEKPG